MATQNKEKYVMGSAAMLFSDAWLDNPNSDETFVFESSLPNQQDTDLFYVLQNGKSDSEGIKDDDDDEEEEELGGGGKGGPSASGLPEKNFNVLSADKKETLSIPPDFIEPTKGSKNYLAKNKNKNAPAFAFYLCKMYTTDSTCTHGSQCDFIHSRHVFGETPGSSKTPIKAIRVHWSTPVSSINEAPYERHEPGSVIYIGEGGSSTSCSGGSHASSKVLSQQSLASENVYKTKGSEEALQRGSKRPLRLCKHYERGKCARGCTCNFIHRVHLAQSVSEQEDEEEQEDEQQQQQQNHHHHNQIRSSLLPAQSLPPSILPTGPFHYSSQVPGINVVDLSQGRGYAQQVLPAGMACLASNIADCVPQPNVVVFDAQGVPHAVGGGGVIVPPQFQQQQQQQQQQYFNTHNNKNNINNINNNNINTHNNSNNNNNITTTTTTTNNNKNKFKNSNSAGSQHYNQSCVFANTPGETSLASMWTSQRPFCAENSATTTTTPVLALPFQSFNSFFGSQQQQPPSSSSSLPPQSQQQQQQQQASGMPISSAQDYFIPQVLFATYMHPSPS